MGTYADDLAVIAETEEELIKRLNEWKDNAESKGMGVNMNKSKVMISGQRQKVRQKAVSSVVKVLVAIHYSVLVVNIFCSYTVTHYTILTIRQQILIKANINAKNAALISITFTFGRCDR